MRHEKIRNEIEAAIPMGINRMEELSMEMMVAVNREVMSSISLDVNTPVARPAIIG